VPETFDTGRLRATISTWLFVTYSSIAIYVALMAVVGIISTALLMDHAGRHISVEYADV